MPTVTSHCATLTCSIGLPCGDDLVDRRGIRRGRERFAQGAEDKIRRMVDPIPMKRMGKPEEIAAAAGFVSIRRRLPATDTGYPALMDPAALGTEEADDPECPHTLVVEAEKPRDAA